MFEKLTWLGHASFRIDGEKTVFIDPWKVGAQGIADMILISHSHYDHFSEEDVLRLRGNDTVVVTVSDVASRIDGKVEVVKPGGSVEIAGVRIEAPPAYNIDKQFHPKSNGWVGFVVGMGTERLYYAGDTDLIPEMENIRDIDVALLPVGGTYTMDAGEAARAAALIKPRIAVPYHWGDIVGSSRDAQRFADLYDGRVEILQPSR